MGGGLLKGVGLVSCDFHFFFLVVGYGPLGKRHNLFVCLFVHISFTIHSPYMGSGDSFQTYVKGNP